MIRRPPRSTQSRSSAASDVYKRQVFYGINLGIRGVETWLKRWLVRRKMKCPFCDNPKTKVIDSRSIEDGCGVRRRRHCLKCGSRFTTFERREKVQVVVVKRGGSTEPYSREKLATGMYLSLIHI